MSETVYELVGDLHQDNDAMNATGWSDALEAAQSNGDKETMTATGRANATEADDSDIENSDGEWMDTAGHETNNDTEYFGHGTNEDTDDEYNDDKIFMARAKQFSSDIGTPSTNNVSSKASSTPAKPPAVPRKTSFPRPAKVFKSHLQWTK